MVTSAQAQNWRNASPSSPTLENQFHRLSCVRCLVLGYAVCNIKRQWQWQCQRYHNIDVWMLPPYQHLLSYHHFFNYFISSIRCSEFSNSNPNGDWKMSVNFWYNLPYFQFHSIKDYYDSISYRIEHSKCAMFHETRYRYMIHVCLLCTLPYQSLLAFPIFRCF